MSEDLTWFAACAVLGCSGMFIAVARFENRVKRLAESIERMEEEFPPPRSLTPWALTLTALLRQIGMKDSSVVKVARAVRLRSTRRQCQTPFASRRPESNTRP
jgi:hypothetical protein